MELTDLIVLGFSENSCYYSMFEIEQIKDKNFKVNLEKKTWDYYCWQEMSIGEKRPMFGWNNMSGQYLGGIIGVYDRNSIKQLKSMVFDLSEYIPDRGCFSGLPNPDQEIKSD